MVATTMESQAPAELIPRINFPADQLHLKMQEMFDNNRGNGNSSTSVDMAKFQGAAEQLDYNMPLLSVRRYRSEGDQWKTSKKVWKLSAELSKEPLRLPGSVPFEWERTPGQPKLLRQTEAPSPMPSTSSLSDNTNHTDNVHLETAPSPSSSQLPPPHRPATTTNDRHIASDKEFLDPAYCENDRSSHHAEKSCLPSSSFSTTTSPANYAVDLLSSPNFKFLPPPPPPPPPPPRPFVRPLIRMHSAPPPRSLTASPSPPHLPPLNKQHDRIQFGFCLVDPTTDSGFRRILQARRKLAEPELEIATTGPASHDSTRNLDGLAESDHAEISKELDHNSNSEGNKLHDDVASISNGGDAAVTEATIHPQKANVTLLETETETERFVKDDESTPPACQYTVQDDHSPPIDKAEAMTSDSSVVANTVFYSTITDVAIHEIEESLENSAEVNAIPSSTLIHRKEGDATKLRIKLLSSNNIENSIVAGASVPNTEATIVKSAENLKAVNARNTIKTERQAERSSTESNHETYDYTCRSIMDVQTLRMIKTAVYEVCKKAATTSIRAFSKAKNKVIIPAAKSVHASLSVYLTVHDCLKASIGTPAKWDAGEKVSVTREAETTNLPERERDQLSPVLSSVAASANLDRPPIAINSNHHTNTVITDHLNTEIHSSPNLNPCPPSSSIINHNIPIRSPLIDHIPTVTITSSPPARGTTAKSLVSIGSFNGTRPVLRESSSSLSSPPYEDARTSSTLNRDSLSSPSSTVFCESAISLQASPDIPLRSRKLNYLPRTRSFSSRPFHSKSVGGDHELLHEFFHDAPSRFHGSISRSSTPGHHSTSSILSSAEEEFLDAASSPFYQTPRTSLTNSNYNRNYPYTKSYSAGQSPLHYHSNGEFTRRVSNSKLQSKLSKRLGKALWLDMRELAMNNTLQDGTVREIKSSAVNIATASSTTVDVESSVNSVAENFVSGEKVLATIKTSRQFTQKINESTADGYKSGTFSSRLVNPSLLESTKNKNASMQKKHTIWTISAVSTPVFPAKCQKNRLKVMSGKQQKNLMSANNDESKLYYMEMNVADVGWPLGISGYPEALMVNMKKSTSSVGNQAGSNRTTNASTTEAANVVVPSPPLPPSPAGGSWLRKALSSTTNKPYMLNSTNPTPRVVRSGEMGRNISCNNGKEEEQLLEEEEEEEEESSPLEPSAAAKSSWEAMVRGSHGHPGSLRFSEVRQYEC